MNSLYKRKAFKEECDLAIRFLMQDVLYQEKLNNNKTVLEYYYNSREREVSNDNERQW